MSNKTKHFVRSHKTKRNAGTVNYFTGIQRAMYNGKKEFFKRFERKVEVEE